MTPSAVATPLAGVVDVFVDELDALESIFQARHGRRTVIAHLYDYIPIEDGCLLAMWDGWHRFMRNLLITSASGPSQGLSGSMYTPLVSRTESQVLTDLKTNKRGNNFGINNGEPKWGGLPNIPDLVNFLGLANANVIIGAVSATTVRLGPITVANPLEEVRKCRNYAAHKTPPTQADLAPYCRGSFVNLSAHLRQLRSGVETFSEWRDCFSAIAGAAAQ